jgi:hypothetical protein
MSRYDYPDPGQDPEYCNALSDEPDADDAPDDDPLAASFDRLSDGIDAIIAERHALVAQQRRIARILREFRDAPLSISSVQPLLQLADELNQCRGDK